MDWFCWAQCDFPIWLRRGFHHRRIFRRTGPVVAETILTTKVKLALKGEDTAAPQLLHEHFVLCTYARLVCLLCLAGVDFHRRYQQPSYPRRPCAQLRESVGCCRPGRSVGASADGGGLPADGGVRRCGGSLLGWANVVENPGPAIISFCPTVLTRLFLL